MSEHLKINISIENFNLGDIKVVKQDSNLENFTTYLNYSANDFDISFIINKDIEGFYNPIVSIRNYTLDQTTYLVLNSGNILNFSKENQKIVSQNTQIELGKNFKVGCGGRVARCLQDAYSEHGWISVGHVILTAFLPWDAVALAGACAVKNC